MLFSCLEFKIYSLDKIQRLRESETTFLVYLNDNMNGVQNKRYF